MVSDERTIDILDKGEGKGAVLIQERVSRDKASGDRLFTIVTSIFARGDGGFGGPSYKNKSHGGPDLHEIPQRAPDLIHECDTRPDQAFLYALSGDRNPLHRDPAFAKLVGFPRPHPARAVQLWHRLPRRAGDGGAIPARTHHPVRCALFQAGVSRRDAGTLGIRVMRAIADYLCEPADAFAASVTGGDSILRLLHYPPAAFDGPAIRAGAHEDINAITLLLGAEEAGLELLDREGRWLAVNPAAGTVVVNIGDMLARLTNDVLPSTSHRVVNPAADRRGVARYSTPFFLHFRPEFEIETLASCVSEERPARYPEPITAAAFLAERLRDIGLA